MCSVSLYVVLQFRLRLLDAVLAPGDVSLLGSSQINGISESMVIQCANTADQNSSTHKRCKRKLKYASAFTLPCKMITARVGRK